MPWKSLVLRKITPWKMAHTKTRSKFWCFSRKVTQEQQNYEVSVVETRFFSSFSSQSNIGVGLWNDRQFTKNYGMELPPFDLEFDLINRIKFKTFKKLMFTWLLSLLLTSDYLLLRFSEVRVITHYLLTLGFKISPVTRYLPITLKASQCLHSLLLNLLA